MCTAVFLPLPDDVAVVLPLPDYVAAVLPLPDYVKENRQEKERTERKAKNDIRFQNKANVKRTIT